ncbi:hypothetical protein RFI_05760 [Reticulomyxa filosa]|uniref:Uncharacterized protein n=1 Tax=Reticulomyxa filosa TaxID=46433 RepID=X6NZX2_RETFI|nr:hypothetical protein RFI_05760 [Reticulomyxa filosa]|eukprot:ETO31364.1 hypothetical protein RFI_05760 [Reticulomyxa filosa]
MGTRDMNNTDMNTDMNTADINTIAVPEIDNELMILATTTTPGSPRSNQNKNRDTATNANRNSTQNGTAVRDHSLMQFLAQASLEHYYVKLNENNWTLSLILNISNEQDLKDLCEEWGMSIQENVKFRAAWNAAKQKESHNEVNEEGLFSAEGQ